MDTQLHFAITLDAGDSPSPVPLIAMPVAGVDADSDVALRQPVARPLQIALDAPACDSVYCKYCKQFQPWRGGTGWYCKRCPSCNAAKNRRNKRKRRARVSDTLASAGVDTVFCPYCEQQQPWRGGTGWSGRRCPTCNAAGVRARYANTPPEILAARRSAKTELSRQQRSKMTPEELADHRDIDAERVRQYRAAITPEERAERNAKRADDRKQRRANISAALTSLGCHSARCPSCEQLHPWRGGSGWNDNTCPSCNAAATRKRIANLTPEGYASHRARKIANERARIARMPPQKRAAHNARNTGITLRRIARKRNAICGCGERCFEKALALQPKRCAVVNCNHTNLEADHVIALHNGGLHCGQNAIWLCKSHNASKHARDPAGWASKHQLAIALPLTLTSDAFASGDDAILSQ